ncbi:MAG: WGR domain-containing protein [bacterium]|nr:WGR domain-containing protein [bacterium]
MANLEESITLYFQKGKSDKMYQAFLQEVEGGFTVNYAFGRRGTTLKTETKTKEPLDYDKAKKVYDKLIKSKMAKGYTEGESGTPYIHTDKESQYTGIDCQLLSEILLPKAKECIEDDGYFAQEKHDGKRLLLSKGETDITAINKKGISCGAPEPVIESAKGMPPNSIIDGETVNEMVYAFDLLKNKGLDTRNSPYEDRLEQLEKTTFGDSIRVVTTARTSAEKQGLFDRLEKNGAEGIVFKKRSAEYLPGSPAGGGDQFKYKFYKTASVIVSKQNDKRSVAMEIIDRGQKMLVGNVTIPPNKDVPAVGSVIEVRYLYAYEGGSLYQPTYKGVRDDVDAEECLINQLIYKKE